ncbi:MAG: DUF2752 domain-containing protein [Phycisphaerae bacterium]
MCNAAPDPEPHREPSAAARHEDVHAGPRLSPGATRLYALLTLATCAAVLALAVWLKPDTRGYGTHEQLRVAPCGWLERYRLPCPTCGMTTAFSFTVRGRFLAAAWAQPAGFSLALMTVALAVGAAFALVAGRVPRLRWPLLTPYRVFWILLLLLVGGWAFKLAAGLLAGELPLRR